MAWHRPKNVNEWLAVVFRHKKKFFFPALLVMISVIWSSKWLEREYFAEAKFQRVNDSALGQMGGSVSVQNLFTIRRQLNEDIKGRPAVEQLVNDLQLTKDLSHTSDGQLTREGQLAQFEMVRRLRDRISVYFQVQSDQVDQIVITFADSDPDLTPKLVNQVVDNYIRKTRAQLDEMLVNAKSFFEREVIRYRGMVGEMESKKLRFELDNPGLAPNDPASIQTRLVELRTKLDNLNQELSVQQQKRNKLQEFIKNQPEYVETKQRKENPALTSLLKKKNDLGDELEKSKEIGRTEEHPVVKKIRQRMAELDKEIAKVPPEIEGTSISEPNLVRIQTQQEVESLSGSIIALEKNQKELNSQVKQYEIMNRNFFIVRNEYQRISRELEEAVSQLSFWDGNLHRTTIALTSEVSNRGIRLSWLQRANENPKPAKPTLFSILSAAVLAGVGVGVLLILLAEMLDHSFHSVDQVVDGLRLPVLGAVNQIITPTVAFRQRVFTFAVWPAVAGVVILLLLVTFTLTYYNLENPLRYEQLVNQPVTFLHQMLLGS